MTDRQKNQLKANIMKSEFVRALLSGCALCIASTPALAQDAEPSLQDVIIVTGSRLETSLERSVSPEAGPLQGGDVTYLTARTPGGARIGNGEVSGQMQYRGLFGERLNLRVDGQSFSSGGPNLMDPAFHYAPAPLVDAIVIDRGVSSVSDGPGLGGGADAIFKKIGYSTGDEISFGSDLTMGLRSVNNSISTGGVLGASTDSWRFNVLGALEKGSDTKYADGEIGGTEFERNVFGISTGVRGEFGELSLDLRRHNAGPSGNPPFPMDIQYVDTDFARLGYAKEMGDIRLEAELNYMDVAHLMDNFSMRPSPPAMRTRATTAVATTSGGKVSVAFPFVSGELELGGDLDKIEHDVIIRNPNNSNFFVTPFPDVEMDRLGAFAEWRGRVAMFESELGLRVDENDWSAGNATLGPALPTMPRMLASAFNAAERSGSDTTVDAVAQFWTPSENGLSWRMKFAHKQQMPGYIQRFGWLPINASGGLADGNIYIGDLTLEPETAWIAEAGFDYASPNTYFRPTVYIRQIDDYVQGTPFDDTPGVIDSPVEMVANMNGDPTPLIWSNVDARIYGLDFDAGYDFEGPLRLDGVFNYVRGERRDIDDNLYRIAPPNVSLGLTYEGASWSTTLEARAFAEQDEVSQTNSEAETDGYVVLSAYADWQVSEFVHLTAGVENLLDEVYQDHLAGYNRNGFGDVPVGERLPGAGRGAFVRLSISG